MIDDRQLRRLQKAVSDPKNPLPRPAAAKQDHAPIFPPRPLEELKSAGRKLGKYTLVERLASNSWKALEEGKPNPRVVRILGGAPDKDELKMMSGDLAALAKIRHPLLVGYHKVSAIEGIYFIVRDYVDGRPLTEAEFDDPVLFLRFFMETARIVEKLHAGGVCHGDLVPSNIIVGPGGMPIVVDVGMLRIKNHFRESGSTIIQETPARDVAALGEIFWRMMSGKGTPDPAGGMPELKAIAPLVDADLAMFGFRFMRSSPQPFAAATEVIAALGKIHEHLQG